MSSYAVTGGEKLAGLMVNRMSVNQLPERLADRLSVREPAGEMYALLSAKMIPYTLASR